MTLDKLSRGDHFIIERVVIREQEVRRRLVDMGFHSGIAGKVVRTAPLGDPIAVRLLGYDVSLRKDEASGVVVKRDGRGKTGNHKQQGRRT
ncbi:MAG: ferrous iron transport protein A [Spirochaetes bacterium]|nr:ferrous iron transport protein A [Spirochaetota bacterium]